MTQHALLDTESEGVEGSPYDSTQPTRRAFLKKAALSTGGATLGTLLGCGEAPPEEDYVEEQQPQSTNAPPVIQQSTDPYFIVRKNGTILIGPPKSAMGHTDFKKASEEYLRDSASKHPAFSGRTVTNIVFNSISQQLIATPLGEGWEESDEWKDLEELLPIVERDFAAMGIGHTYALKPLRGVQDLIVAEKAKVLVCKVLGYEFDVNASLSFDDGYLEIATYQSPTRINGISIAPRGYDAIKKQTVLERDPLTLVAASDTRFKNACALYSEPLHDHFIEVSNEFIERMMTRLLHESPLYHRRHHANVNLANMLVNEAVIHGMCHHWLEGNAEALGLDDSYTDHVRDTEKKFRYMGARPILEHSRKVGRAQLKADFEEDPEAQWEFVRSQVPEYQHIK